MKLGRANARTYGVVATELVEHAGISGAFDGQLVNRFGIANLRKAAHSCTDLPDDHLTPDITLANRLREFIAHEFTAVVEPILAAADASTTIDLGVTRGVRRLIDAYAPRKLQVVKLRRSSSNRTVWGHCYDTLVERAAVEVFELHAMHARLRRCIYCGSVYVPYRDERYCQWTIWPYPARADNLPLRLCSSERHAALRDKAADVDPSRHIPANASASTPPKREREGPRSDEARIPTLRLPSRRHATRASATSRRHRCDEGARPQTSRRPRSNPRTDNGTQLEIDDVLAGANPPL